MKNNNCKNYEQEMQEEGTTCPYCKASAKSRKDASETSPRMVQIPSGSFLMGSPASESGRGEDEGPQQKVNINSFWMGIYPVSQKEYEELAPNPSQFKGQELPVDSVSWYEAVEYCNKLSLKKGLIPAYDINGQNVNWNCDANGYRLPTEAEWEYACRAETVTPFSAGNNITTDQANYDGNYPYRKNPKGRYLGRSSPAESFEANPWGLYNMHGNVWEWCWDWYGEYSGETQTCPLGVSSGTRRVLRGGSWGSHALNIRSARRNCVTPSYWDSSIGFRLVRS